MRFAQGAVDGQGGAPDNPACVAFGAGTGMQNKLLVKGMDSPRHSFIGIRASLFVVALLALLNWLFSPAGGIRPRTAGLETKIAALHQLRIEPESGEALPGVTLSTPQETLRTISVRLRQGETPAGALTRVGADPATGGMALTAVGRMVDMRTLKAGQRLIAELNDAGRVGTLRFPVNTIDYIEAVPDGDAGFKAERKRLPVDIEIIEGACGIRGTLYDSFKSCGLDRELVPLVVDLLESQVDLFTEVRKGDTIRIVAQKESVNGDFVRYGRVEGLLFEGKAGSAGVFMYENADGSVSYYDAAGHSIQRPFSRNPIRYNGFTASSSLKRQHPILYAYTPGRAVDYPSPRGTPVLAVGDGRVIFSGRRGSSGNMVVIRHQDGIQTYYAKLETIRKGLRKGAEVQAGDQVGTVGGGAKNPFLHFAVAKAGRFVNTSTLAGYRGVPLPEAAQNDFLAFVGRMTGRLKSLPVRGIESSP